MKNNELLSYVYDFISILQLNIKSIRSIKSIILFGSIAREDYDEESDIDIFIDLEKDIKEVEELVNYSINQFEIKARETWHLKGIKNPIKCITGSLDGKEWSELRKEIISNNIVLYGSTSCKEEELKPYYLFQYSLKRLSQKKRMDFLRKMNGYRSKKEKKVYVHNGLLDEVKGIKLENNNTLVPVKDTNKIQKLFVHHKITPKIKEIWLKNEK